MERLKFVVIISTVAAKLLSTDGRWPRAAINPKQQAHELIDRMSVGQVVAVVGLFKAMLDPVEIALANAPIDDEPLTVEEIKALDGSCEWLKHNEGIPH